MPAGIQIWDDVYNLIVDYTTYCGRVVAVCEINGSVNDSLSVPGLDSAVVGQTVTVQLLPATGGVTLSGFGSYSSGDYVPHISFPGGDLIAWTGNANTAGKSYRATVMVN